MRLSWLCAGASRTAVQPKVKSRKKRIFNVVRSEGYRSRDSPIYKRSTIVIRPKAKHPALQVGKQERSKAALASDQRVVDNFSELSLRSDVVKALEELGVSQPTVIQMLAIPKILKGKNVLCAAETGSGKTLAYLAPLISRLKYEEEHHGVIPRLKRPRALILLPSRDLAAQVLAVAKSLCHVTQFRAVGLIGGVKRKFIKEALLKPLDIAIATPDSLLRFRKEQKIMLSDLSHLIIDEADTLFDSSFKDVTVGTIRSIRIRTKRPRPSSALGEGAQVTLVGATLSDRMLKKIDSLIPNLRRVSTKHLHRILPHVEQRFHKLRQDEKSDKLVEILRDNPNDIAMVFCNTVPSCDWTARHLRQNDIAVIKLHAGFSPMDRKNLLKDFQSGEGGARILVCTDIASRGIDTSDVNHVVLFDFPNTLADYLHRVGRTGRVGSKSNRNKVTSFLTHRRDVAMAWKIKNAADKSTALMDKNLEHQQRSAAGRSAVGRQTKKRRAKDIGDNDVEYDSEQLYDEAEYSSKAA